MAIHSSVPFDDLSQQTENELLRFPAPTFGKFVEQARELAAIGTVYGARHGIEGVLKEELLDLSAQPAEEISLLRVTPACLSPPHGEARPVCVVGEQVIWDGPSVAELEPALRRFAAALGLDCVQLALAPTAAGPAVVAVETRPYLEQFGDAARAAIVDAVVRLLT